jgi:hypothetical protein
MSNATLKRMTHGHGQCIMLLVAERMGLSPAHLGDAKDHLGGKALHPMVGAAIEREAIHVNDQLRHDASLIAQANTVAEQLLVEHGFVEAKTAEAAPAL